MPAVRTIARGQGATGDIALRRRQTGEADVYELIVNGVFAMDTAETSTERLLAEAVLDRHPRPSRLLVGGLGLGYTAATLLADERVAHVDVAEIEPLLVDWLRAGTVPGSTATLADPRIAVTVADVRDVVEAAADGTYDGVLLDVDNGPDFLVHDGNTDLYDRPFLSAVRTRLAPRGVLAVWLAAPSQHLLDTMTEVFGHVDDLRRTVERGGRSIDYHVYVGRRAWEVGGIKPEKMRT